VWMCSLVYHSNGVIEQGTKQKMCPWKGTSDSKKEKLS
jgi:hypothetical protein